MSRSPSPTESAALPHSESLSESTTADAPQLVTDEIPWSSSSSSSGGIPEFSTRAWPIIEEPTDRRPPVQIALDYLHQSIPAMQRSQQPTSTSAPATQARLETARRETVAVIARYFMIMQFAENRRSRRVSQSSRWWRSLWTWIFGRSFWEEVNQELAPLVSRVTQLMWLYFRCLDWVCDFYVEAVREAESIEGIDRAFRCFFHGTRELDAWRLAVLRLEFEQLRRNMDGLLATDGRRWMCFVDAFFALALDGSYPARNYQVGVFFLAAMNASQEHEITERAWLAVEEDLGRGMNAFHLTFDQIL
jgi:hypothetical protein